MLRDIDDDNEDTTTGERQIERYQLMVLGRDSHPSLHVLDKVSQPSDCPQCLGKYSHTSMHGP